MQASVSFRRAGWRFPSAALFIAVLSSACEIAFLAPLEDAGPEPVDSGDAAEDSGVDDVDAGSPDDAGVDAGPLCDMPENPPIPWECEDDVDWCDAIGDSPAPSADLLATWSYLDGDDVVIQMRFAAMPFWDQIHEEINVLVVNPPVFGINDVCALHELADQRNSLYGNACVSITEREPGDPQWTYPPEPSVGTPSLRPFDPCRWRLHRTIPLAEVRLPASIVRSPGDPMQYGIEVNPCLLQPIRCEVSWVGDAAPVVSLGGRADETDGMQSICDLQCSIE